MFKLLPSATWASVLPRARRQRRTSRPIGGRSRPPRASRASRVAGGASVSPSPAIGSLLSAKVLDSWVVSWIVLLSGILVYRWTTVKPGEPRRYRETQG